MGKNLETKNAVCEYCGELYYKRNPNGRFCSMECSKKGQPYYRNRELKEKPCAFCGNVYSTSKKISIYCSDECRKEAGKKYSREHKDKYKSSYLKMRFEVLKRDNFRCRYCGRGVDDGVKLQIDHVVARNNGGENGLFNYLTACEECNIGKSDVLLLANKEGQIPTFLSIGG